jgi:hypothetical protein
MNLSPPYRTGDNLHRTIAVIAPLANQDIVHTATTGGEESSVPPEQAILRKRIGMIASGVQHHFNDALNITVCRDKTANIHTKTPGD